MNKLFYGALALPLLTGVALAQQPQRHEQPLQLTSAQLDHVTAGWDLLETDVGNTSITVVGVYNPTPNCPTCVVNLHSPTISVTSMIRGY